MAWFGSRKKKPKKEKLSGFSHYPTFLPSSLGSFPTKDDKEASDMGRLELRQLASKLRFNPYVVRYLSVLKAILLGSKGFVLDMQIKDKKGGINFKASTTIETEFNNWAKAVSTCGRFNLQDLIATALCDEVLLGESFLEKVILDGELGYILHNPYSLDDTYNDDNRRIVSGIRYSKHNQPIAYYFKTGDKRREVMAKDVKHLYRPKSASDFRGTTSLAPVINLLKKLDKFTNAVLDQQIINSATSTVYEKQTEDAEAFNTYDQDYEGNAKQTDQGQFNKTLNSKEVLIVPKGYSMKKSEIGKTSPSNSSFIADTLKRISSGLLIPYHAISNDLGESSYSSLKFNSLLEESHFSSMQTTYINLYRDIVEEFISLYSLRDPTIDIDSCIGGINIQAYQLPPLDPTKDSQVNELELKQGVITRTQILAKRGLSYEQVLVEKQKEDELDLKYGVQNEENK